ncbi:MAG: signal peptidase I, partial [Bacteroidota bacterium]
MNILIFFIISYVLLSVGLYFLFQKTDKVEATKGLIPVVNFIEWCKLVGRPTWHVALLFVPLVNIFIYAGMAVEMVRSFGKYQFWQSVLAVLAAPIYFIILGKKEDEEYLGPNRTLEADYQARIDNAIEEKETRTLKKLQAQNPYKKSAGREWIEAVIFAVFAAAFIRMFLVEAYVIPTSSMEGSMLVGDFLFVSKAHYGIRTPKTVAMVPLLHNRLPVFNSESYLKSPSLEFRRLPAIENIDRNDPVVFNYPEGDSVYVFPTRTWSIYDYRRNSIKDQIPLHHQRVQQGKSKLVTRPIDKKDHYIKRCVAVGGDSLEIRDRQLYINGQIAQNPVNLQFVYLVRYPPGTTLNTRKFEEWGIS